MGYDAEMLIFMIVFSLIVIGISMYLGYLVSQSYTETPTLGDVLLYTVKAYGINIAVIIGFVWWAVS